MNSIKTMPISTLIYYYSKEPSRELKKEISARFKCFDKDMLNFIINNEIDKIKNIPDLYHSSLVNNYTNIERLLYLYLQPFWNEKEILFSELVFLSSNPAIKKYSNDILNMTLQNIDKRLYFPNEDYELLNAAKSYIQVAQINLKSQQLEDDVLIEKLSGNFNLGPIEEMLDIDFFQDYFVNLILLQDWKRLKQQREFLYKSINDEKNIINYSRILKR